jgi:hypothetical protein
MLFGKYIKILIQQRCRLIMGIGLMAFLLVPFSACAQKPSFEERLVVTLAGGAGELRPSFGAEANQWSTHFNYRFGFGYRISKRIETGIGWSTIVLKGSDGWAMPNGTGGWVSHLPTKGESLGLLSIYVKFVPISNVPRLSLQLDLGFERYNDIEHPEYGRSGTGYCVMVAYNLLNDPGIRIEPYLSFGASVLDNKTVNGVMETGWAYQNISLGVALVLARP